MFALTLGILGSLSTQSARAATCPCTIFGTQTPKTLADSDTVPIELGVKFRADRDGGRHRDPVLQGLGEHRHAHRFTVERHGHPARDGDLHR